jgi:hypothetical protein
VKEENKNTTEELGSFLYFGPFCSGIKKYFYFFLFQKGGQIWQQPLVTSQGGILFYDPFWKEIKFNQPANKRGRRTNPGTEVEPQQIVAQRLLSCLQYPVPIKSSTEDLTRPTFCSAVK